MNRYFRKSLLARYTLVATLLVLSIFLVVGWMYITHIEDEQQASDSMRAAQNIQRSNSAMRALLWQADFALSEYLITPSTIQHGRTVDYLNTILAELKTVQSRVPGIPDNARFKQLQKDLQLSINQLRLNAEHLMTVRVNREMMCPAMPTIVDTMNPANIEFTTAANLMLAELDPLEHTEAVLVFRDLKLLWLEMISEFRVFMAFRTGTFGAPEVGMQLYSRNVEILHDEVMSKLKLVEPFTEHEEYGFQASASYEELLTAIHNWYQGYEVVKKIQSSPEWRMDVPLLQRDIYPVLVQIQTNLAELDQIAEGLYAGSVFDIEESADNVYHNLVLVALLVSIVVIIGFIYLRNKVLAPILNVSQALLAEARGETTEQGVSGGSNKDIAYSDSTEITDLTQAFRTMHEQVKMREEELAFMAHHDALTQLPNRVLFRKELQNLINKSAAKQTQLAVILIGLDRFKEINDTYGYRIGDEVLCEFGRILKEDYKSVEALARLAGDEFVLAIQGADEVQARHIATSLHTLFNRVFRSGGHRLRISASIGVAVYPAHGDLPDSLISRASIALHQAKHDHSIIAMYSRDRDPGSRARIRIVDMLRHALEKNRLTVEYQPQISFSSDEVVGFEALSGA